MARKVIEKPQLYCWDCALARVNEDPRYRTPDDKPIFKNCYRDPNNIKRGIMDNTLACSQFKRKELI